MARRKRLSLAEPAAGQAAPGEGSAPETRAFFPFAMARSVPPVARVAGDAASMAAFSELAQEVTAAREEGRLIQALPLDVVDETHLVRDRLVAGDGELAALVDSIRARGQQVPIEVVALEGGRYGLISGWRRLAALRRLRDETPDPSRFATVLALLRRPESASDAYLAMVEENEIRVGLSYYERARIVARATEQGVFPTVQAALTHLFAAASRAKRSKIGSFLRLYAAFDDHLHFPGAISERLGLAMARALDTDRDFAARLRDRLRKAPADSAQAELGALERALTAPAAKPAARRKTAVPALPRPGPPAGTEEIPGIWVETGPGFVTLRGPEVTAHLQTKLLGWLRLKLSD